MVYFLCKAYDSGRQNCCFALSLPVRGAWVEMPCQRMLAIFIKEYDSLRRNSEAHHQKVTLLFPYIVCILGQIRSRCD